MNQNDWYFEVFYVSHNLVITGYYVHILTYLADNFPTLDASLIQTVSAPIYF